MATLGIRERNPGHETAGLGRVVSLDRGFEVLAERCRLTQLPPKPAEEAHRLLVGHVCTLPPWSSLQSER